ncbi:hypothetical protein G9U52_23700 [Paenibacillus sp. S3N08]|uniref:Uncharacterized protein n=1 Tax=Paenibacillus agricola TaxID=2716264 RepID=A0ABX0JF33_9BACL|nr:hypothetical protein [Paenibacillus agricola]
MPKWLVANWDLYPRLSRASGDAIIPALSTRICNGRFELRKRWANASMEDGSKRSNDSNSTPGILETEA